MKKGLELILVELRDGVKIDESGSQIKTIRPTDDLKITIKKDLVEVISTIKEPNEVIELPMSNVRMVRWRQTEQRQTTPIAVTKRKSLK